MACGGNQPAAEATPSTEALVAQIAARSGLHADEQRNELFCVFALGGQKPVREWPPGLQDLEAILHPEGITACSGQT